MYAVWVLIKRWRGDVEFEEVRQGEYKRLVVSRLIPKQRGREEEETRKVFSYRLKFLHIIGLEAFKIDERRAIVAVATARATTARPLEIIMASLDCNLAKFAFTSTKDVL